MTYYKKLIIYLHSKEDVDKAFKLLKQLNGCCWKLESYEKGRNNV